MIPLFGWKFEEQKMNKHEIHCQVKWPPFDEFTHNNQPKIGACKGGENGGEAQRVGGTGEA